MSSFQQSVPGSLTSCAPVCWLGCHSPITAPSGSAKMAMRPASITSIGGAKTVPPLAVTLATVSSTLSTLT